VFLAGVFKIFVSIVRVAQSDRDLISDYYHPCVHGRGEASEFVWWYYQVTAWTAEESTASLSRVFGTVRRRSGSMDRHMFWKKGMRFCYDVTPMRQCKRKVPMVYFFSLSLRNLHSWRPKVEHLLQNVLSCGVFHHGSSSCVVALSFLCFTFFTQSRENTVPVIVDSVRSLTSAKRAWILIVWELILHGRSIP